MLPHEDRIPQVILLIDTFHDAACFSRQRTRVKRAFDESC